MLKDGAVVLVKTYIAKHLKTCCNRKSKTHIQKQEKCTEPKNYRLVSLLSVMSKVTEIVVHNQLIELLEKYEIIFDYQSDFRSKHSVNTCLAHLSHEVLKGLRPEN